MIEKATRVNNAKSYSKALKDATTKAGTISENISSAAQEAVNAAAPGRFATAMKNLGSKMSNTRIGKKIAEGVSSIADKYATKAILHPHKANIMANTAAAVGATGVFMEQKFPTRTADIPVVNPIDDDSADTTNYSTTDNHGNEQDEFENNTGIDFFRMN